MDIFESSERLEDPLKDYANRVFSCSVTGAHAIKHLVEGELPMKIWLSIVFEFLFFYIALTRGHGRRDASPQHRDELMTNLTDLLIAGTVDYVFDNGSPEMAEVRRERYKAEAIARVREYSGFEEMIRDTEVEMSEDTALWSFCSLVSKLAGQPEDFTIVMTARSHVYDSLLLLKMRSLLKHAPAS